jgi:amidase
VGYRILYIERDRRFDRNGTPGYALITAMAQTWKECAAEKKRRQADAIPKEWLIKTPASTVLDVIKIPEECRLLSARELEITDASVDVLLQKLREGAWTAVEVTTAFYKRAIIAHQLVIIFPFYPYELA